MGVMVTAYETQAMIEAMATLTIFLIVFTLDQYQKKQEVLNILIVLLPASDTVVE